MERNKIILICLIISTIITTVICKPGRKNDEDVKEVETNAADKNEENGELLVPAPKGIEPKNPHVFKNSKEFWMSSNIGPLAKSDTENDDGKEVIGIKPKNPHVFQNSKELWMSSNIGPLAKSDTENDDGKEVIGIKPKNPHVFQNSKELWMSSNIGPLAKSDTENDDGKEVIGIEPKNPHVFQNSKELWMSSNIGPLAKSDTENDDGKEVIGIKPKNPHVFQNSKELWMSSNIGLAPPDDDDDYKPNKMKNSYGLSNSDEAVHAEKNCWLQVNAPKFFEIMEALEGKHHQARRDFQKAISERNLNDEMLKMMLATRAAAERAIYNANEIMSRIPAGINLGGYGMMKMDNSLLFFHRMKQRNDTNFKVNYLNNDVYNMLMTARLSLNDLALFGQYERAITDKDAIFYRPTFGELELLLKSVTYKVEGRLRLVQSRLVVEHVLSELHMKDILLMYYVNGSAAGCQSSEKLPPSAIAEFLERLKADLDSWLKDYFNDYLLYFQLSDAAASKELHCYDKQKQTKLNDFMDYTIQKMHEKLYSMSPSAACIKTPSFSIFSINGVQIKMHSGVIRGMDSFYRQSVATGRAEDKLRMVDAVIGFSKLKMEYKYVAKISGRTPPLMGLFVLSADEMIAHLGVTLVKEPEAIELSIGYLRQFRPQTLVIEGAVNRMVGNFKHVLENEIITLMTNALLFHIKQLASLSRCEPTLQGCGINEGEKSSHGSVPHAPANKHDPHTDYGVKRNDSIELEVPGDKKFPAKKIHIQFSENFALSESILPGGPTLKQKEDGKKHEIVNMDIVSDDDKKVKRLVKKREKKGKKQK